MTDPPHHSAAFRHAVLLYAGEDDYLTGTLPFVRAGLEAGEPVLVMVPGRKLEALRSGLGGDASEVMFADMADVGANPARIIPAWRDFVSARSRNGTRVRGIGEPIWKGRTSAELVECHRHESLINVAFGDDTPMDLLCPYDEDALGGDVIEQAFRSHPVVLGEDGQFRTSPRYSGRDAAAAPFRDPLAPPPEEAALLEFEGLSLDQVRGFAARGAIAAGLPPARLEDLVLAVNELASNSVRHGGGRGVLRIWSDDEAVIAEVSDSGQIDHPLAGREAPQPGQIGGHGLWLVNQVCDLMQMRTYPNGSVVRVHVRKG